MISLIGKDIKFNMKWFLLLLLISILSPVIYIIDNETRMTLIVFILFPVLANTLFLPKSCYLDDNPQTKMFLNTLPITKQTLIGAKYLLGLICVVGSPVLTSISACFLGLGFSIQAIGISFMYLLIYYSVFLFAFYKSNYSNAEKANQALTLTVICSLFVIDRNGILLDTFIIEPLLLGGLLALSLLIYGISFILSTRFYLKKQ